MENQETLEIGIGTKEFKKLEAKKVKIEKVEIEIVKVNEKDNKKITCKCKHPDVEDLISVGSVKIEKDGKLEVTGLWINKDEDGKIRKGSTLAMFMNFCAAPTIKDLEGKEIQTVEDTKGYLCFKAY